MIGIDVLWIKADDQSDHQLNLKNASNHYVRIDSLINYATYRLHSRYHLRFFRNEKVLIFHSHNLPDTINLSTTSGRWNVLERRNEYSFLHTFQIRFSLWFFLRWDRQYFVFWVRSWNLLCQTRDTNIECKAIFFLYYIDWRSSHIIYIIEQIGPTSRIEGL